MEKELLDFFRSLCSPESVDKVLRSEWFREKMKENELETPPKPLS